MTSSLMSYLKQPMPDLVTNLTYQAVDYVRGQLVKKPKIEQEEVKQEEVTVAPEPVLQKKESEELSIHLKTPSSVVRREEVLRAFKDEESISVLVLKKDEGLQVKPKDKKPHSHSHHNKSNRSHSHRLHKK